VSPLQQKLQNLTGGALNTIKLIGMNSTFAQILGKLMKNKMSENLKNFENFKEKKVKIQPCAQPTDLPKTGQML
jgi:peroxiredoxin family protein